MQGVHQSEDRNGAAHRSSSVYSVFSGEIFPVTGWRKDVALRLWLQDRGRWKIQEIEHQNGRHFVIKSMLVIPPNEAVLRLNMAAGGQRGPAGPSQEPQLIFL